LALWIVASAARVKTCPSGDLLVGIFEVPPGRRRCKDVRDVYAEGERQPGGLDYLVVGLGLSVGVTFAMMSGAERNRRAANGWELPELTERRLRERGAEGAGSRMSPAALSWH
jgi:hypothetical protein